MGDEIKLKGLKLLLKRFTVSFMKIIHQRK